LKGPEEIQNFKRFYNFNNSSLFAILYKSKSYKLIVFDSVLYAYQRGVHLIDIECESEPEININNTNANSYDVFVYCR